MEAAKQIAPPVEETIAATAQRDRQDSTDQMPAPGMPVSYSISIAPIPELQVVQVVYKFALPAHLAGVEAFHFTLNHAEAGIFARKLESCRKKIKP